MNTAAAPENWEGQIVDGKFPLLKRVGGSERGEVFRTQLPGKDAQAAAIKLIAPEAGNAERQVGRWQVAATLTHPHLLRVLDAGHCKIGNTVLVYVVLEWAEEDLSQVLPARALSADEARQMLPPLLDAISYLHSRGLVHGRIKPSNIMAVADQLRLSTDSVHAVTEPELQTLARSAFDAPEIARGAVSRAADVWSLGVTLVRCMSQRAQVRENYNPIEQGIAQTIPEPFRRIARECLRPDPKARCTLADIREWMRPEVVVVSPANRGSEQRKAPSLGSMALILMMVMLVGIFGWKWATREKPAAPARSAEQSESPKTAPAVVAPQPAPAHQVSAPPQAAAPAPAASTPAVVPAGPHATPGSAASATPPSYSIPGEVVERVVPDVPVSARHTITGKVRVSVRVEVNAAGEISDAALAAPGPSKYFARLALDAARGWKFKPAQADNQPVASAWMLRFQFGQSGTEASPTELPGGPQ